MRILQSSFSNSKAGINPSSRHQQPASCFACTAATWKPNSPDEKHDEKLPGATEDWRRTVAAGAMDEDHVQVMVQEPIEHGSISSV